MNWIGDFAEDFATVTILFTTHDANGAPVAPLSAFEAADVSIYKNGSATQKATANGLTMTSPFDSIVGLHALVIDTSNDTGDVGFWTTSSHYTVVLAPDTETVNGQTVVKVIGTFGIALAGAGSAPSAATVADAVWDEARAGHVGAGSFGEGVVVNSIAAAAITATSIASDAITDVKVASDVTIASVTGAVGSVTGNVGGNVTGSVGSVASGGIASTSFAAGAIDAAAVAADAGTEIGTAVWASTTRLLTAGTNIALAKGVGVTGFNDLSAAEVNAEADAALADVGVTTTITGRIDVATSTRLATAGYTAPDNSTITAIAGFVDTEVAATLAAVDTEVAAIKAKTDNLPAAPAAAGDIPTAIQNADALLDRNMATGADSGSPTVRTVRQALRLQRNKWAVSAGTLTVYKEDDSTTSWTSAVSTEPSADPIRTIDPAGP